MNATDPTTPAAVPDTGLRRYTHWMYGLHALAVAIGLTTAATVVGAFVGGLPSIIAVIMNYARRAEARGTLFESHFRWQLRTFWFALLWAGIALVICAPLVLILIGAVLLWFAFGAIGLWIIYRVLRGWLALRDGRTMPVPSLAAPEVKS
ncbi:MAG: hypothetical protein QM718_09475 [Steroidobacteraceae bacterium]